MAYIIRPNTRGSKTVRAQKFTTDELVTAYVRKHRATGRVLGGLFTEVEDAGIDRSRVEICRHESSRDAMGHQRRMPYCAAAPIELSRDHVRAITDADQEQLDALDVEIERLREAMRAVRLQRQELLDAAWRRGDKVYAGEIVERANARLELLSRA